MKVGVPITDALPYGSSQNVFVDTGRWTIGPTVEVRLIHGFSAEVDALYRGYSFTATSGITNPVPSAFSTVSDDTKVWDFPILLKYRFQAGRWRPFVTGGYTLSHFSSDLSISCFGTTSTCGGLLIPPPDTTFLIKSSGLRQGPTVGGGLEFKLARLKIAPEIRYTHLNKPETNQATVLVGFTF